MMPPRDALRRHQLAYLTPEGWQAVLAREWDPVPRDCLHHWACRGLPLVVTRQPPASASVVCLGLPAARTWARRRIPVSVSWADIARFGQFPLADAIVGLLPPTARPQLDALLRQLRQCALQARCYGSHGWQYLTGLPHLHAGSDLDLWIGVECADHADAAVRLLSGYSVDMPRLDGELVFPDGAATAWREWAAWRAGAARGLLVKRTCSVSIEYAWNPPFSGDGAPR